MKIYVGNLSKQITDKELNDLAVPFGTLQSANVATERSTGQSKGFGFLEFANEAEAKAAILKALQAEERYYTQNNTYVPYATLAQLPAGGAFPYYSADSQSNSRYTITVTATAAAPLYTTNDIKK